MTLADTGKYSIKGSFGFKLDKICHFAKLFLRFLVIIKFFFLFLHMIS